MSFQRCLRVCLSYFSHDANDGQWMVPMMANDANHCKTIETSKVKIEMCEAFTCFIICWDA
jgi:hypothetical protein